VVQLEVLRVPLVQALHTCIDVLASHLLLLAMNDQPLTQAQLQGISGEEKPLLLCLFCLAAGIDGRCRICQSLLPSRVFQLRISTLFIDSDRKPIPLSLDFVNQLDVGG
jgi:hypothetical protein